MHETRLCLSLLALADEALRRDGAERIVSLRVEVGDLSGVVPEALAAAFPVCAAQTRAAGATLELDSVPGRGLMLRDMEVD